MKGNSSSSAAPLSPPVRSANQSSSLPPASPSPVRPACSSTVWPPGDKYGNTQKIPGWTSRREIERAGERGSLVMWCVCVCVLPVVRWSCDSVWVHLLHITALESAAVAVCARVCACVRVHALWRHPKHGCCTTSRSVASYTPAARLWFCSPAWIC